ncbi:MAG: CoA transferase [Chloroflexi bacterium]|nr:CoA transferase [Chloroflexota bacterium]
MLGGIKVLEYANFVSGPFCARLLADAGAEVLKVEPPGCGDEARRRGPFPDDVPNYNASGLFMYLNTNKQSITLDPSTQAGKAILLKLLAQADIFIENYPPKLVESLGLDYATLQRVNPRLIATSITPFGLTGPYRDLKGDDLVTYSMGGMAHCTPGVPDYATDNEREYPLRANTHTSDYISGLTGAVATMLALLQREETGEGSLVDVSQFEVVASFMTWNIAGYTHLGFALGRHPPATFSRAPNTYVPCKDGYVVIVASQDNHWQRFVEVMGNPEWAQTELFSDSVKRGQYWDALLPLLLEWTMAHTGEEIGRLAQARGIPCFPTYTIAQTVASEHFRARGTLREFPVDGGKTVTLPGLPYHTAELPKHPFRPAPRLGEHTEEVLCERLGYSREELVRLRGMGVI